MPSEDVDPGVGAVEVADIEARITSTNASAGVPTGQQNAQMDASL